ncbi:MAG TPA: portal protein [Allosphingosinicella sp.]|jgi:hypothetical protein
MKYDVETILRQQAQMESGRSLFDAQWLEVAERVLPRQADFLGAGAVAGGKRGARIFDEHAMLALGHHSATYEGFLIPRGSFWMALTAADEALMKNRRVAEWYDDKTRQLFRLRYAPKAGFQSQIHESFDSLGAFGNQALWIDGLKGLNHTPTGLFYRSIHIGEIWVRTNFQGRVDRTNRKFTLEARQAVQMWGDKAPECALKAMKDGKEGEQHEYIHALFPRADADPERIDGRGLPVGSMYIAVNGKQLIEEGGYRSMPLVYSRYETSPREDYGRGPGMKVLPAVKACQAMMQSLVRGVQLGLEKPMGAPHEDVVGTVEFKPRGITYGAIGEDGRKLVQAIYEEGDIASARDLLNDVHSRIDEAFLKHLMPVGEELKSHVSASAFMQRAGERGIILSPVMSRQETELLDPMTERELDIMADMGLLDDMPPEVKEAGGAFAIRYDNPLSRMQRAEQAAGFFRTFEAAVPALNIKPEIVDNFNFDVAIPELAEINAVPVRWMADPKKLQAARAVRKQEQETAQALAAAPDISGAVKNIAQAEALSGGGARV